MKVDMTDLYDFLVVGSGPSGCAVASRLARSAKKPKVLLLEAGSDNADIAHRISGERYTTLGTAKGYNWGYSTVPQDELNDRIINYSRGKGLGGSSAINFGAYVRGPQDDYDQWAKLVDDETWAWTNTRQRFNRIETYHGELSESLKNYIDPSLANHGHSGPVDIGFAEIWEKGLNEVMLATAQCGHEINKDLSSGDPLGFSVFPTTAHKGQRITASTAYLANPPDNLTIITEATVSGILFSDKQAVGVTISDNRSFRSRETILSAGALDTPKLLLLSGIGPAEELKVAGVNVLHDVSRIGKGLRDHCFSPLTILQKPGTNDRPKFYNDPRAIDAARQQWLENKTGDFMYFYGAVMAAFLKSERVRDSSEFCALPEEVKEYLNGQTIPDYEFTTHSPPLYLNKDEELKPTDTYLSVLAFSMNPQGTGELHLRSNKPEDSLLINPRFLSHPFDRRTAIESVRHAMELIGQPSIANDTVKLLGAPKGTSDEDILEYVRASMLSSWHMCGTVKMGKDGDKETCVDRDFRLIGLRNLRVVDMSIAPMMTNNHTQSTAYLIGETAADKIISEYDLDRVG